MHLSGSCCCGSRKSPAAPRYVARGNSSPLLLGQARPTAAQPGALPRACGYRNSQDGPKYSLKRCGSLKDQSDVSTSRAGSVPHIPWWRWDFKPFLSAPSLGTLVWGASSATHRLTSRILSPWPLQSHLLK